jgi:diguanylate cyclase (GGDEF)-like protein
MIQFISIKYKLALVYLAFIAEIFLVIILIRQLWTIPQFLQLEQIADKKDLIRIENMLNSKIDELALVNYDNAVWDDAYQFALDKNVEFIEENFVEDTFVSLDLSGLYYLDNQGRIIFGASYERGNWQKIDVPFFASLPGWFIEKVLVNKHDVVLNQESPITHKGIIFIEQRPVIFAATSVLPSNARGESNGTLMFYREIQPEDEQQLSELSSLSATFIWPSHPNYKELLNRHNSEQLQAKRNEKGELTLASFDFLNQTPYFITIKASPRAFDISLFDTSLMAALALSLFGILFLFYFVSKRLIQPIKRWNNKISTIVNGGNYTIRFTEKGNDEFSVFSKKFNQLLAYVEQQNKEIKQHNMELVELSHTDGLTKIFNRRYFDNEIHSLWTPPIEGSPMCLFMVDIDYFKQYNDNYGHQQGDKALQIIAKTLLENTKRSQDIVARYGGEEFVVILKNTEMLDGMYVAENLCRSVSRLGLEHLYAPLKHLSISIGVASTTPSANSTPRELIHQADEALYVAKDSGRNRVAAFKEQKHE